MRRIFLLITASFCLASLFCCQGRHNDANTEKIEKTDSFYTLESFFGEPLVLNDSVHNQISEIAAHSDMLSYEDSILQIGEVKWGINISERSVSLFTSVSADSPKMKAVIDYMDKIYGEPYEGITDKEWPECKWSSSTDSVYRIQGTLVHLRPARGGAEGTFIMFH